jgi:hypothetical protein
MKWAKHVAHTGKRSGAYVALVEKPERKGQLGRPDVDDRIILKWIFRKWDVRGMKWIDVAEDRDKWQAVVNALMNLRVP